MTYRKLLSATAILAALTVPALAHAQSVVNLQCHPQMQNGFPMLPGFTPSAVTVYSHAMVAGFNGDIVWDGRIGHAQITDRFVGTLDLPNHAGVPVQLIIDRSTGIYTATIGAMNQTGVCVGAPF